MAVIKKNPWTDRAREEYFKLIPKMKYALGNVKEEDARYLVTILDRARLRLESLMNDHIYTCKNCGKPSLDFMPCKAKEFKEDCIPVKNENYDYNVYWELVDKGHPEKPSDEH